VSSGQRSINSDIAIDGTDFNDALQGNQRGGNEGVFFFPQAAVREFQVIRSGATAEVGRTNSGFVNVVTKSGSNELHGEGFYYDRERSLTSPDAFVRTDAVAGSGLFNAQGTYTRLRGENFNFDSLQLNQAVSTNFMRKSDSVGVKAGLTTVFGLGLLNDLRGQIATDDRNEMP